MTIIEVISWLMLRLSTVATALLIVARIVDDAIPLTICCWREYVPVPIRIFQSYSHHDWDPTPPYGLSRLQALSIRIRKELRTEDPRSDFCWMRDREGVLRYADKIDATIQDAVDDCDIGLVILSGAYVASPSCQREFDLLSAAGKPVFIVQLEDIERELDRHEWGDRRTLIAESLFCKLFQDVPSGTEHEKKLGPIPEYSEENSRRFNKSVDTLAEHIRDKGLRLLLDSDDLGTSGSSKIGTTGCDVLVLAPCPDPETCDAVNDLKELLEQKELTVQTLGWDEVSQSLLKAHITQARVVAQVLGIMSGDTVDNVPMAEMQYRLGESVGKRPHAWLTPMARNFELFYDYRKFVQKIEVDERNLEEFASSLARLAAADKEREALVDSLELRTGDAIVVIDAHQKDWDTGRKFQRRLVEECNMIDNIMVQFVEEGKDSYRNTKELLKANKIHAVLMMYGPSAAGLTRFNERMPEYRKKVALQRQERRTILSALAVGDPCSPGATPPPRGRVGGNEIYRVMLKNRSTDDDRMLAFIDHVCEIAKELTPYEERAMAE